MSAAAFEIRLNQRGLNLDEVWLRVKNRRGLMAVLGREGANKVKDNLRQRAGQGNKLNAPTTGYWNDAARSTRSDVLSETTAVVTINHVGVRLHLLGGEVVPVTKKWLTIAAIPEAHGKRATEFKNLFVLHKADGTPYALGRHVDGEKAEIVYWLVKSSKHRADPTVLPSGSTLCDALRRRAGLYLDREMFKGRN